MNRIIRIILIICLVILSTGCYRQTVSQVGPNRFAFTTPYHGSEDRTLLLKKAYDTCQANGFKDYGIIQSSSDDSGSSLMVQCGSFTPPPQQTQAAPTSQASTESWSESAGKLYQSFKDSFK